MAASPSRALLRSFRDIRGNPAELTTAYLVSTDSFSASIIRMRDRYNLDPENCSLGVLTQLYESEDDHVSFRDVTVSWSNFRKVTRDILK